jgi:hypothetical protein
MMGRIRSLLGPRPAVPDDADDARIRREGHVGRAIVIAVEPLRTVADGRVETRIRLDVLLPRHRRFSADIVDRLDAAARERVRVGAVVPVAADLQELGHVVLDFDQLAVNEEALAALGPIAGGRGGPKPLEGGVPDRPGPGAGR